jgi:hypothetical protein
MHHVGEGVELLGLVVVLAAVEVEEEGGPAHTANLQ